MEFTPFQQKILDLLPCVDLRLNESMAKHTSFRIGGDAEVMAFPKTVEELSELLKVSALMDCKPAILGAGTNVLAPDEGLRGLVICLKDALDGIQLLNGDRLQIAAGVTMTRAAVFAAMHGLGGLEFAHGIPGTVGGGVYMNAGAYGAEICQVCESVEVMYSDGRCETLTNAQMQFSYRHSILQENGGIVVRAVFQLYKKPHEQIRAQMQELMARRKASQPLELPSAGSAFKRPVGAYAAALIEQTGLKGLRVGDAAVSEKHAGFVVNLGSASAADVRALLCLVSQRVYENTGFELQPEVRIW